MGPIKPAALVALLTVVGTPRALSALNTTVRSTGMRGKYVNVVETMSERAMKFQELVTGGVQAGTSFLRGGVKFDYFDTTRRVLMEAKGPGHVNFVNKGGEFYKWFRGKEALADQAKRQIKAADGEKVVWVFSEQRALDATRKFLLQKFNAGDPVRQALKSGQLSMRVH